MEERFPEQGHLSLDSLENKPRIYQSQQKVIWTDLTRRKWVEEMEDKFQKQLYLSLDSLEEQTTDLSKSTENDLDWPDPQHEEK